MKLSYLSLIPILFATSSYCSESKSIKEVSDRINSISVLKNENKKIHNTYDPFKTAKPIIKSKKVVKDSYESDEINLQTILNKRAFINSRWYNTGEKIQGYKIEYINKNSITLSKNMTKKILAIKNKKSILKYTDEKLDTIDNKMGKLK